MMTVVCKPFPSKVNRLWNQYSQQYVKDGIAIGEARIKAAIDIENYLLGSNPDKIFGSQGTPDPSIHNYQVIGATLVRDEASINDIFEILDTLNENNKKDSFDHNKQLDKVVDKLIIPLSNQLRGLTFKIEESNTSESPEGRFNSAQRLIEMDISNRAIKDPFLNRFRLSFKEIAAHEFVHAITTAAYRSKDPSNTSISKGIRTLYNQAKKALEDQAKAKNGKPWDVFSQTVDGVVSSDAENQAAYDYIFNNPDGQGVEEFISFGSTNELFRNILSKIPTTVEKKVTNFREAIDYIFDKIVNFLIRQVLHIKKGSINEALEQLTFELAGVKKKQLHVIDVVSKGLELSKFAGSKTLDTIVKPLIDYIQSPAKTGVGQTIQLGYNTVKSWKLLAKAFNLGNAVGTVVNNLVRHREFFFVNLLMKLPQELAGMNVTNEAWHKLLAHSKKIVDSARHKIKDATVTYVRELIGSIDDDEKRALTSGIVMTDLDDLRTYNADFTFNDYRRVLADEAFRDSLTAKAKAELIAKFGINGHGMDRQAHGLGLFMQTKETFNEGNQAFNAYTIARGDWDPQYKRPANWEEAIPLIQQLKTLYSIKYTTQFTRDATVKFFDSQASIPVDNDNGFNGLVSLNATFKAKALAELFQNDPSRAFAGYVKDINAPDVGVVYSTKANDPELENKGYKMMGTLGKSQLHNGPQNYVYVANNLGLVPWNKMSASMTSRQVAGTTLTDMLVNEGSDYGTASLQAKADSAAILTRLNRTEMYSSKVNPNKRYSLFPVYGENGVIVNHRYMMTEENRKKLLSKDTRIDNVFGVLFESITDKVASVDINNQVVDEIIKEHQTMYRKSPKGFITVTANHPAYGETYKLLPKDMKAKLDAHFGEGKMIVRESMISIIFGFRTYSLFTQGDNTWVAQLLKGIFIGVLKVSPGKYYRLGRATEQGWQELIQEIKTFIVLKTSVLGFNVLSNAVVSFMHGMPLNYITKMQGQASLAVEDYVNNYRQKLISELKMGTVGISPTAKANLVAKIKLLEADMANSPIIDLIDAGLLNSIVEDITIDDNDFGIKGKLHTFFASKTKWVPKPVRTAYDVGQIGPKTSLYKVLEKTTRYSDFVARYAMYEWYTQEKKIGAAEALKIVTETFVNYDLPTSKELQYLNDIGASMFTKYAIRIQKTIYRQIRDNPKSIVGLLAVESMFGNVVDPYTDSIAFIPGMPQNPLKSMDDMMFPLYQIFLDMFW